MTLLKTNPPMWSNLSDFFDDDWLKSRFRTSEGLPAINVVDNDDNYEIQAAIPGYSKDDIQVSVESGVLTITGESKTEANEETKNYTRKEFSSRSFSQSFTLPENADDESVTAKYENGVLHLTLQKTEKSLPPKKDIRIE
jgi:HSP20 family protein